MQESSIDKLSSEAKVDAARTSLKKDLGQLAKQAVSSTSLLTLAANVDPAQFQGFHNFEEAVTQSPDKLRTITRPLLAYSWHYSSAFLDGVTEDAAKCHDKPLIETVRKAIWDLVLQTGLIEFPLNATVDWTLLPASKAEILQRIVADPQKDLSENKLFRILELTREFNADGSLHYVGLWQQAKPVGMRSPMGMGASDTTETTWTSLPVYYDIPMGLPY